jgi:hypothetical protein
MLSWSAAQISGDSSPAPFMSGSKGVDREARAIAEVPCPDCGVAAGQPCRFRSRDGRPPCCTSRRRAWQLLHQRDLRVEAIIDYLDGRSESLTYNHDDADDRRDFARRADAALRAGATVTTRKL